MSGLDWRRQLRFPAWLGCAPAALPRRFLDHSTAQKRGMFAFLDSLGERLYSPK